MSSGSARLLALLAGGGRGAFRGACHARSSLGTLCHPWPGAVSLRRFRPARRPRPWALVAPSVPLGRLVCPVAVTAAILLVFEHLPAEHLALPVRRATARGAARHLARLAHHREVAGDAQRTVWKRGGGTLVARRLYPFVLSAAATGKPSWTEPTYENPPPGEITAKGGAGASAEEEQARVAPGRLLLLLCFGVEAVEHHLASGRLVDHAIERARHRLRVDMTVIREERADGRVA